MLHYDEVKIKVYNQNIWDSCESDRFLVSVVVVTCQRRDNMEKNLFSILSQKTNFDFEIVIIDEASSDGTFNLVDEMCQDFIQAKRLKYIKVCNRLGYTKPSYLGAAASDGKIIIFQPSDIVAIHPDGRIHTGAFQRLVDELQEDTIVTFVKECWVLGTDSELKKEEKLITNYNPTKSHAKGPQEAWFCLGAIRWLDYIRLTDFRIPYVDSRLGARLLKSNRKVKWIEDVTSVHFPHPSSAVGGMSQHWWTVSKEPF